jgi:hypothetical protein
MKVYVQVEPPPSMFKPVDLVDLVDIFYDFESTWLALQPMKATTDSRISFNLANWHFMGNGEYVTFRLCMNLYDVDERFISAIVGEFSKVHNIIIATDKFMNIKEDIESIRMAIHDALNNTMFSDRGFKPYVRII